MRQKLYGKCSQWYFTIDRHECSNPAPIDGIVYHAIASGLDMDQHRHGTIIGMCRGTSAGNILSGPHQIAMNIRSSCAIPYGRWKHWVGKHYHNHYGRALSPTVMSTLPGQDPSFYV